MADKATEDIALSINGVHKDFKLPHERKNSLKERLLSFNNKTSYDYLHALKGIDIQVKRGEFFGIVGRNGSGKSTLLKIIGGIYQPSKGSISVNGTLTPFIELGIGFNPELTGRENVFLNGAILGLTRKEVNQKYDEIVAFAELGKFMDQKLKNYSSGMQVRLAFSIAIQAHNDILLIDEVLAVGDAAFQRKCLQTFKKIKQSGKTVVFVSHGMDAVREYCDRAVMIENGKIVSSGDPDKVANDYIQLFNQEAVEAKNDTSNRWGDFKATISDVDVAVAKETVTIEYKVSAKEQIEDPILGIIVKDMDNHHIMESNTKWKKIKTGKIAKAGSIKIRWEIPNVFKDGKYRVTVAAAHEDGFAFYDWQDEVTSFESTNPEPTAGLVRLNDKITLHKN